MLGQPSPKASGLAIAALVVGIVAFLLGLLPVLGAIVGLAGVGLGVFALVKKQSKGLAITGLVLAGCAVIASIGVTAGIANLGNDLDRLASEQSESVTSDEVASAEIPVEEKVKAAPEVKPEAKPEPAPEVAPAPEPEKPTLTIGQSNAVSKAKSYLDYTSFSRTGLIQQLEFEGFSVADATFAVDHVSPDWNAQAAAKAADYLDYTSFSRQGLIDQLVFEGFSLTEAEFGVAAVGY